MTRQYVKIYCCGDCQFYDWKLHKCRLGAHEEGEATDSFYWDCPLGIHEEEDGERDHWSADGSILNPEWYDGKQWGKCVKCTCFVCSDQKICPNCGTALGWE